ncbi:hypothetical protein [Bradyrhizobium sp. WD16]|uniref:hypothetical protein n=1 Tax=Bradyrhizobium sp. WD16 TaxID=1521768 RepID=UPI0020A4708D|nr:hypothetical protein [Bradyrhizobium sp. WD16]UTD28187.1 hypothetical protein DB459_16100 [Bradyrhizobium sp. WD16]
MTAVDAAAAETFCAGLRRAVIAETAGHDAAFVRSYRPAADESRLPNGLASTALVYDNALAAIALVGCGEVAAALPIGRALIRAARQDRTFSDGRLRNAYRAGPLDEGPPLLPGWWDSAAGRWAEDPAQDGTSTGNVAWGALALLTLHGATGDRDFLAAASHLIEWVSSHASCGEAGFCGGFHGYDPQQVRLTWKSTEHNVDVAAAAGWLARVTGQPGHRAAAMTARRFLNQVFSGDHFLLGTRPDGLLADPEQLALDVQLWPWMALDDAPRTWRSALLFAELHLAVDDGFDFDGDRDGVWVEGTAQAALAYRIAGQPSRSAALRGGLRSDQTDTGLLNATRHGRVSTGLSIDPTATVPDFFYFRRPHLGATAWAALAESDWNPFTGRKVE